MKCSKKNEDRARKVVTWFLIGLVMSTLSYFMYTDNDFRIFVGIVMGVIATGILLSVIVLWLLGDYNLCSSAEDDSWYDYNRDHDEH